MFSSAACSAPTPITTVTVAASSTQAFYACVTSPINSVAVVQPVYFQVKSTTASTNGQVLSDVLHDAVNVTVNPTFVFTVTPSNTGEAPLGGSATYAHNISNTGNQQCGASGFTIVATPSPAGVTAGWTTALYLDVNNDGQLDSGDTLITGGTLPAIAAGATVKVLVRVFVGNSAVGSAESVTVTVTDTTAAPNNCVINGANPVDTTTVNTAVVKLEKKQSVIDCPGTATPVFDGVNITRKPGECIAYQVIATNTGASAVTNVSVNDVIPANSNYAGATQPAIGARCVATKMTAGSVSFAAAGAPVNAVSCGSASNTLDAGGTVTLRFTVQVNP